MTTYYVNGATGSNSNNGTAAGTPYATIDKARSVVAAGDTVYVSPAGSPYRELVKPTTSGSGGNLISFIADNDGYFMGTGGEVVVTAYTTDDVHAPASTAPLIDGNGINYQLWDGFTFVGSDNSNAGCWYSSAAIHDWTFRRCTFYQYSPNARRMISINTPVDTNSAILFDRCSLFIFTSNQSPVISMTAPRSSTADYDVGWTFQNCLFSGSGNNNDFLDPLTSGASTGGRPGGLLLKGCTFYVHDANSRPGTSWSVGIPVRVINCLVYLSGFFNPQGAGPPCQFFEDGNICVNPSIIGSAGPMELAGSTTNIVAYSPYLLSLGNDIDWGEPWPRRFGEVARGSVAIAWSAFSDVDVKTPGTAADDSGVGSISWTNPDNAKVFQELAGVAYAVASTIPAVSGITHYLKLTNFGFSIPTDATVLGVRVEAIRKPSAATLSWNSVKLTKDGTTLGTEQVSTASDANAAWNSVNSNDRGVAFGGSTNLWGLSLAPADVNGSTFGVFLSAKNTHATNTPNASIDGVRIAVYYRRSGTNQALDRRSQLRPSGGSSLNVSAGAFEYGNAGVHSTTVQDGSNDSVLLTGPGYHEARIPLDTNSRTVSVKVEIDGNYSGTDYPQVVLTWAGEGGIPDQTLTATIACVNALETLTFSAVTSTKNLFATLRYISRSGSGNGKAYFVSPKVT